MTTPEAFCANPRHTLTTITEGDYIRCGDCGGRLRDDDPRLARATNPSQQQHKPPMVAGDHIVRAKAELAAGEYRPAMAHALVAIAEVLLVSTTAAAVDDTMKRTLAALTSALNPGAEQGQPIEHAIDAAELRQQRPLVLTDDELNRAAESLVEQTGMSLLVCGNMVARIIRDINEFEREITG